MCDLCGERGADGDPVVEYSDRGNAHIGCASEEGWEG